MFALCADIEVASQHLLQPATGVCKQHKSSQQEAHSHLVLKHGNRLTSKVEVVLSFPGIMYILAGGHISENRQLKRAQCFAVQTCPGEKEHVCLIPLSANLTRTLNEYYSCFSEVLARTFQAGNEYGRVTTPFPKTGPLVTQLWLCAQD